jgi:hypothetical protein
MTTPTPPEQQYRLDQLMPAPAAPPHAGGSYPMSPAPPYYPTGPGGPPRKPHWWRDLDSGARLALIALAIIIPLAGGIAVFAAVMDRAGLNDVEVKSSSCRFDSDGLPSVSVEYSASNTGNRDRQITIHWEFRDASGSRVDTDTTSVSVPAGDTVRGSETTLLPVAVSSGSCGFRVS